MKQTQVIAANATYFATMNGLTKGRKDVAKIGTVLFRLAVKNASDELDANLVQFFRKICKIFKIARIP